MVKTIVPVIAPPVVMLSHAEPVQRAILSAVATPLAPDQLRARLEHLTQALRYDLGAAEPVLADLRAGVSGTLLEPEIAAIAAQIDVFAIDEALTQLSTLQAHLNDTTGIPE